MSITITIAQSPQELGIKAAKKIADLLREAIEAKCEARIILSTGASQFETMEALTLEGGGVPSGRRRGSEREPYRKLS